MVELFAGEPWRHPGGAVTCSELGFNSSHLRVCAGRTSKEKLQKGQFHEMHGGDG